MPRTGRVSTTILGAFEVAQNGDLANWATRQGIAGGIGGAMARLAAGGAHQSISSRPAPRGVTPGQEFRNCLRMLAGLA